MKRAIAGLILSACLLPDSHGFAQARASADYSISIEADDSGGQNTSSMAYTVNGSVGGIDGISGIASTVETAKSGYFAQVYNIIGLVIDAPSESVESGQTIQLGAIEQLDDLTFVGLDADTVTWGVQSGPIARISSGGLATASVVYKQTTAVVAGNLDGFSNSLELTVTNAHYGAWQSQYFGVNNPLAAPEADADGTGQTNLFKYIAGLNPVDDKSRFIVETNPAASQPGEMTITLFTHRRGKNLRRAVLHRPGFGQLADPCGRLGIDSRKFDYRGRS